MKLSLTEDQELLRHSVERFAEQYYSFEHRRAVIKAARGYDLEAWRQFADMGWLAINVPEPYGGAGGSHADLLVLAQGLGPAMTIEPWIATAVIAAELIKQTGSAQQQAEYLPDIAAGARCWAFAGTEPGSRYSVNHITTLARRTVSGYALSGVKMPVLHLPLADHVLVTARTADDHQAGVFIVDPAASGVSVKPFETIDGQCAGELTLHNVMVAHNAALFAGESHDAAAAIEQALDLAAAVSCAEAVGVMRCVNHLTTEYLRSRKQFGEPIGKFQALQHRLANMYMAEQRCISALAMLRYALVGASPADRQRAVSAAKVQIDKSGRYIGQQSIQLHGGIGITDEYIIGHYFKRLTAIGTQFGDLNFHLDRLATLMA